MLRRIFTSSLKCRTEVAHSQILTGWLHSGGEAVLEQPGIGWQENNERENASVVNREMPKRRRVEGARVLDGRKVSEDWNVELKVEAQKMAKLIGRPPCLCVFLVGNRPDSMLYVSRKEEVCKEIGIRINVLRLPETISQEELESRVKEVCSNPGVDGVLVQLPLPRHLDEEAIMETFDPSKDVDGFHALNMGRMLMRGRSPRLVPCTPLGCMHLLRRNNIDIKNKTAVVLGDSNIVGTPLSVLLRNQGAAIVTVCHGISYKEWFEDEKDVQDKRAAALACHPALPGPAGRRSQNDDIMRDHPSEQQDLDDLNPPSTCPVSEEFNFANLPAITRTADILVVAVGQSELVKADWVKPGAVVLDVGINVTSRKSRCLGTNLESGEFKIVGDVAFKEVSKIASAISPVPGGVGPMTISGVVHNTIKAAYYNHTDRR